MLNQWRSQGLNIQIITLLLDDPNDAEPPTMVGVQTWKDQFGLHETGVYADPNFSMVPGNEVGTPQPTVINPRTMVVDCVAQSCGASYGNLVAIAQENAAQ